MKEACQGSGAQRTRVFAPSTTNHIRPLARGLTQLSLPAILLLVANCGSQQRQAAIEQPKDPVAAFIQQNMQPGSAAFFVPSPIHRGQPVEAVLEIAGPSQSPEELSRKLALATQRPGIVASGEIRVAARMHATLVTDRECAITPKDPADQAVDPSEGTKWRWTVTPKQRGTTQVTVTLTAPVIIDGRETFYSVTSFERTVAVTVTGVDITSDLLAWARSYWTILAAAAAGLGGLVAWLKSRRSRKRPAGFGT